MKSIACVLLFASLASAQLVRGAQVQNNRAAAAPAEAGAATAKSLGAAPPAGGAAPAAPVNDFGPAFFGPGVGNFAARAPLPALVARAREVAASDPNVRVFVDVDGTIEFTDKFGREVEVLDAFGRDALEIPGLEEQIELQQQQFQLERRRALLTQELNNLNILAGGAAGGAPGAAGAAAAAPAFRIVA